MGDLAAMLIDLLNEYAGDEVEKINHEDDGRVETLTFNFSNGRTFQVAVQELKGK